MNKRIVFITENPFEGCIHRDHPNLRVDLAWMCSLNAYHLPLFGTWKTEDKFDLAIIIIPKKNISHLAQDNLILSDCVRVAKLSKKVAILQEGPCWYFTDWTMEEQIWYINQLASADFLLCHNEGDKLYYEGLTNKRVYTMHSVMIPNNIKPSDNKNNVIIGGNMTSWYSGFESYIIAQEFDTPIYCPSMGRKIKDEDKLPNIYHLPYSNWNDWMMDLSKFKYAIHLMRVAAAGTFFLNTSYLSIPTIGYNTIDTARILHPDTVVDVNDLKSARQIAIKLKNDNDFYDHCSKKTRQLYDSLYSEKIFIDRFDDILKQEKI